MRRSESRITVRAEHPGEQAAIAAIVRRAFGDDTAPTLVGALREHPATADGHSFIAECDGVPVGYLLFSRGWLDAPSKLVDVHILSPIGVVPEYQRSGIGTALMRHGLDVLARGAEPLIFLEGAPDYYPRFGFERASRLGFTPPSPRIPDPAFQVYRLPAYEPWMTGGLVCPDPFWRLDAVGLRSG